MVIYGKIPNDTKKCMQFDVSVNSDPKLVYVPSEGNILIYEIQTGEKVKALLGHYNCVNSCIFHPFYQELYSGGNDKNVLIWTAEHVPQAAYGKPSQMRNQTTGLFRRTPLVTADNWSSDEG
jgi:DNA excision repair protein ERCC-8